MSSSTGETMDHPKISLDVAPRPRHRVRNGALLVGGGALLGASVLGYFGSGAWLKRDYHAEVKKLEVKKIEPITLDMRARTTVDVQSRASVDPKLDLKVARLDLDSKNSSTTIGQVITLTGADSRGVSTELIPTQVTDKKGKNKTVVMQKVHIPASSIRFISYINESKTQSTPNQETMAKVGRTVWNLIDAVTPWHGVNKDLSVADSNLAEASRQAAVDAAQETCGQQTWDITRQVIQTGSQLAAQGQGIDPTTVSVAIEPADAMPDFTGPYVLPAKYHYSNTGKLACTVSPDAYTPVILPATTESTNTTGKAK